jgi:hypothetical protein
VRARATHRVGGEDDGLTADTRGGECQERVEGMSQTATESTPSDLDAQQLTAADRCDLCGAQAYIRVQMNSGELLFCAHHGKKYQEKLTQVATDWHDESARLFTEQRA